MKVVLDTVTYLRAEWLWSGHELMCPPLQFFAFGGYGTIGFSAHFGSKQAKL
jgi:hypothetical protein